MHKHVIENTGKKIEKIIKVIIKSINRKEESYGISKH